MSTVSFPTPLRDPVARLIVAGACLVPPTLLVAWTFAPAGMLISLAVFTVGLALAVRSMAQSYFHARLGGANIVTTLRLALVAATASALSAPETQEGWTAWAPACLATVALGLDAFDGWLARRETLSSEFGARYDMEVDSGLAAVLAAVLMAQGAARPELFVLGGARYAFVFSTWMYPWLNRPLPESLRRKAVCVIQIGALVALISPIPSDGVTRSIALVSALLVIWSFAVDIRWLARHA